jgi:hypothetical protein
MVVIGPSVCEWGSEIGLLAFEFELLVFKSLQEEIWLSEGGPYFETCNTVQRLRRNSLCA